MSTAKPVSDPVAEKKPSKDYPWWVDNIDHKITPEVSYYIIVYTLLGACVELPY
jgi:hypothetical protein